jgi:tetratricopeptide (TPR) repeat protein
MANFKLTSRLNLKRGWTRFRDIGSLFTLARLVVRLQAADRSIMRRIAGHGDSQTAMRDEMAVACTRYVQSYCGLLSMKRVAAHYWATLGLTEKHYGILEALDQGIPQYQENQLADLALDVAQASWPSAFTLRVLGGRKFELEQRSYRSDLYDPGDCFAAVEAFELYRRGTVLQANGNIKDAERLYAQAIEADPEFSLARRRHADILRYRDTVLAASNYSEALEYPPQPTYGPMKNTRGVVTALGVHRNFLLGKRGREYIAIPLNLLGHVDISSPALTMLSRRFLGLLLMRLRLRARKQAHAATTNPSQHVSMMSRNNGRMPDGLFGPRMANRLRRLALRNLRQFQFILVDSSVEELTQQIDKVDRLWLSSIPANDAAADRSR